MYLKPVPHSGGAASLLEWCSQGWQGSERNDGPTAPWATLGLVFPQVSPVLETAACVGYQGVETEDHWAAVVL